MRRSAGCFSGGATRDGDRTSWSESLDISVLGIESVPIQHGPNVPNIAVDLQNKAKSLILDARHFNLLSKRFEARFDYGDGIFPGFRLNTKVPHFVRSPEEFR